VREELASECAHMGDDDDDDDAHGDRDDCESKIFVAFAPFGGVLATSLVATESSRAPCESARAAAAAAAVDGKGILCASWGTTCMYCRKSCIAGGIYGVCPPFC
jgi:hypothetical protein